MVNYLIFAGILYSKQIKLPMLLAIEPEPKTLAKLYQRPNIRLNSTAESFYIKPVHISDMFMARIIRLQNWL